ncbi:hypothetical protein GCM10023149_49330 [Mucilaginibacter gynuensis]|uniref:Uncharacterized protein n=1 Tax=Mucilaginibacter gynuensis TaxID=1302236 RepID=A0ABP8HG73_9SPHI
MDAKLNTIKADLYNVFVEGNADRQQLARIFLLLFIPLMSLYIAVGKMPY